MTSLSSDPYLKNLIHYRANCLQPQDFSKPQKRKFYNFPSTERVLNPNKLDKQPKIKRNLSTYSLLNNGNWARMLNRTSKEETISSKRIKSNPKVHISSIFQEGNNEKEKRHNKTTIHTNHSHMTQIYGLPGCVKREGSFIKDDVKDYECRTNYARCLKRDREYGPVVVDRDPIGNNRCTYMGGYGYKDKLRSNVFNENEKKWDGGYKLKGEWKTSMEINDKQFNKSKRHFPFYNNMLRNQVIIG